MANFFAAAKSCLLANDPYQKAELADQLLIDFDAGILVLEPFAEQEAVIDAGRPALPELVEPKHLSTRKLTTIEGRAALVHAIAHIEFNAINLAIDAAYRFRDMPTAFYRDWLVVAVEESKHFRLLSHRLGELGYCYGDFPAHNGLWQIAQETAYDSLVRMALVPRVFEARGLDVTPAMIQRLEVQGDQLTVEILELIQSEEVDHVRKGTRWFHFLCEQRGLEPDNTFIALVNKHVKSVLKLPFAEEARMSAGFGREELDRLKRLAAS